MAVVNDEETAWADVRAWLRRKRPSPTVGPDGRAGLRIILCAGDVAYATTPWHSAREPMLRP